MDVSAEAGRIGVLADPTRQALYDYVAAQPAAVGREAAASALDLPPHVARFQLDRLVEAGLLEVEFRRLSGRTGPGAGRPSKLYRRVAGTVAVSLPERRYDLVGHLLAAAIERTADGTALPDALDAVAKEEGRMLGESAPAADGDDLDRTAAALATQGFEPRLTDDGLILANCPFDSLAREHTGLVCRMNHAYVEGVVDGLGCTHACAHLDPADGRCCVTVTRD